MHIHFLDTTTSTMDELKALARMGAPWGEVVAAKQQSQGRGQHGHQWYGDVASLMFSILYRPQVAFEDVKPFIELVGSAVMKGISSMVNVPVRMQLPNDLFIGERKVGGILIESVSQGVDIHFAVVGIGLNVNNLEFPEAISNLATSLRLEHGGVIDQPSLLDCIVSELRKVNI